MYYIYQSKVPWDGNQVMNTVLNSKNFFLKDDEIPYWFIDIQKYLKAVNKLKFEERPNYVELKKLLLKMFEAVLNLNDTRFDNLSNMPDLKKILGLSDQEFKNQIYEMR